MCLPSIFMLLWRKTLRCGYLQKTVINIKMYFQRILSNIYYAWVTNDLIPKCIMTMANTHFEWFMMQSNISVKNLRLILQNFVRYVFLNMSFSHPSKPQLKAISRLIINLAAWANAILRKIMPFLNIYFDRLLIGVGGGRRWRGGALLTRNVTL